MKRTPTWAGWAMMGGLAVACGSTADPRESFENEDAGTPGEADATASHSSSSSGSTSSSSSSSSSGESVQDASTTPDAATDAPDSSDADAAPPVVAEVYAHSPDELYRLDPVTLAITDVGPFTGTDDAVIDLALDRDSHAWVTTFGGFYSLDLVIAHATLIKEGSYPNSLSFVPAGTLDPNVEALVGYVGDTYVRIDPATGTMTTIGSLGGGLTSSGDIVSVKGGGTFLTATGGTCNDCLLQVNPVTGAMVQNYGSVQHGSVYGVGYWAGTLFGFDGAGAIFTITWNGTGLVATNVPSANAPGSWYGAGSTTSAPPTRGDGSGPPLL